MRDRNVGIHTSRPPCANVIIAIPNVAVAPARVVLTAELRGGSDDFEEFYCPGIQWDWDDGTKSESSSDCEPFEAGKTAADRLAARQAESKPLVSGSGLKHSLPRYPRAGLRRRRSAML